MVISTSARRQPMALHATHRRANPAPQPGGSLEFPGVVSNRVLIDWRYRRDTGDVDNLFRLIIRVPVF